MVNQRLPILYAAANPTVNSDDVNGFNVGAHWTNTTTKEHWICIDNSTGAAVWARLGVVFNAATNPTVNDDIDIGAIPGSVWVNTATNITYVCVVNTNNTAVWNLTSDGGSGIQRPSYTAGENLLAGDAVYMKSDDSKIWKAKADAAATTPVIGYTDAACNTAASVHLQTIGDLTPQKAVGDLTIGNEVFLSDVTAGQVTQTVPADIGDVVQVVGEEVPGEPVSGARVLSILDESPAAGGNLQAGDVVVEFGGQKVESRRQLLFLIAGSTPGQDVEIIIVQVLQMYLLVIKVVSQIQADLLMFLLVTGQVILP